MPFQPCQIPHANIEPLSVNRQTEGSRHPGPVAMVGTCHAWPEKVNEFCDEMVNRDSATSQGIANRESFLNRLARVEVMCPTCKALP